MRTTLLCLALAAAAPAFAQDATVAREETGNRVSENVPAIPAELVERLNRYQNTRGASFAGWLDDGSMLVTTRFAETAQAHRVRMPMGAREQLTFFPEPVASVTAAPAPGADGFVFGFAFGIGAIGAAVIGALADVTGIVYVFNLTALLPFLGFLTIFLPRARELHPNLKEPA